MPLRAHAFTLPPIGFALRSVQTHISKQFRIEMCVCILLKANPIGRRVSAHILKRKINFTVEDDVNVLYVEIKYVVRISFIKDSNK